MKRLRSSNDLDSYNDPGPNQNRSSRGFYYKPSDTGRKGLVSPSARYDRDRSVDEDGRDSSRMVRKRSERDFDAFDRRKGLGLGFDRYSNNSSSNYNSGVGVGGGSGSGSGSGREGYGGNERALNRSEGFRREFPKGFRSERDRSRREGSVSSWRRLGVKEFEENRSGCGRGGVEERVVGVSTSTKSSPKGLRDVRSPSWSRDSGSEKSRAVRRDEGRGKLGSLKFRPSPSWSRDSGSDQSKSVEAGKRSEAEAMSVEVEAKSVEAEVKSVDAEVKSVEVEAAKSVEKSEKSSEMEEGELEAEHEIAPSVDKEGESSTFNEGKTAMEAGNTELDGDRRDGCEKEVRDHVYEEDWDSIKATGFEVKDVNKMPKYEENLKNNAGTSEDGNENVVGIEVVKGSGSFMEERSHLEQQSKDDMVVEKPVHMELENSRAKDIDLEVKAEDVKEATPYNEVMEENIGAERNTDVASGDLSHNMKDKGKGIAVSPNLVGSPVHVADSMGNGGWNGKDLGDVVTCQDGEDDMEGPSTRGFDLFTSSPVRRAEKAEQSDVGKAKDEKLVLEPLDLSLSLPNVLLPIGATRDTTQVVSSPSHGRSVQSLGTFRTNSEGTMFTASMSFSGSQSFFHNPSCSLTQSSLDVDNYEQSVKSRPLFQGIDWQNLAQNDSNHKDSPLLQRILMNGNGSLLNGQGSSKMPDVLERQLSLSKQASGGHPTRKYDDTRSISQSVGSHDIGSTYSFEKKKQLRREEHGGSLYRSKSEKERDQFLIGGADFLETIITRLVSDPVHVLAKKFDEMTGPALSCLKESIRELMLNADMQGQLYAFQSALQNRSDLNLDALLKSHRTQLEILVALQTGLPEYLQVDSTTSSSDLAEVFTNLRCRNLTCRSPLPVDECDCKVCSKKNGFCSSCMCLVCSKFDMASNTCSWVGCDVCLHWCHVDCALRGSYIRNGRSARGASGTSEMQFHCVACDHPSEMFGFVKEVFQNFAKEWPVETFCKELEYVKKIFSASKDVRGRRLHEMGDQMLQKLANKSNLSEVCNLILSFLAESDSSKFTSTPVTTGKEHRNRNNGGIASSSQDAAWLKPTYLEKTPRLERSASMLPSLHTDSNGKLPIEKELSRSSHKEQPFDELESIVRIKQAEARMFQVRADDARREAESLKRIAIAKSEKIEEEYSSRIAKLRIVEAEDMRNKKVEEFHALEKAHHEYFAMKMRMEADIKDLLLKMEATKRNLSM